MFNWSIIFNDALKHRRALIYANIIALCVVFCGVPIPLLMPMLVDEVLLNQPGPWLAWLDSFLPLMWRGATAYIIITLAITLLLRFAMLAFTVWQLHYFAVISKDVTYKLRCALIACLQRVSMAEFETLGSARVGAHLVTDVEAVDKFLGEAISKAIISVLTLIGISLVLLWMHWQLALLILFMNPIVIYFTVRLGKHVKKLKGKENKAIEIFQQALQDTLDAIQQIRASNREKSYYQRISDAAKDVRNHASSFAWKSDAASRFSFGIFLFGFDTFRAVTMLMVVFSDLSVGEMMAVFGYLWFMMSPVQEILNIQYAFYAANAALSRINELFRLREEPQYPHAKNPFAGKHTVSLTVRDLYFQYSNCDTAERMDPVLNGLSLHIEAGEKVALVGASGGGKSTLVQILLGMYPIQRGELMYSGVPISEIGLDVVRENVATVLQHPALFNDTLRVNLTLGKDMPDAQLYQALEVAQLHDVVHALPHGLDSIIGRQGVRLSGGQRQRVAIARMILSDPKIVILDEATSALDAETEENLHIALHDFLQGRTTLIVAHRLSAVKQAQRVLVFENGRIIEDGEHEQLIQAQGLYSRLYGKKQA